MTTKKKKNGSTPDVEGVYQHIGRVIKRQRRDKKLLQQDLAERLEISRPSICLLEKGKQRVMMHDLPKIARAIGVKVIELVPPDWRG